MALRALLSLTTYAQNLAARSIFFEIKYHFFKNKKIMDQRLLTLII